MNPGNVTISCFFVCLIGVRGISLEIYWGERAEYKTGYAILYCLGGAFSGYNTINRNSGKNLQKCGKLMANMALRGLEKDCANAERSRKSELPRKVVVRE